MYGTATKKGSSEDDPINASPYAISKLAADLHLLSLYHVMDFPMQIVRHQIATELDNIHVEIIQKQFFIC